MVYLGERLLPVAFLTRRGDRSTSITSPGPSCTDTTDGAVILRRLCSSFAAFMFQLQCCTCAVGTEASRADSYRPRWNIIVLFEHAECSNELYLAGGHLSNGKTPRSVQTNIISTAGLGEHLAQAKIIGLAYG